jgi:hypothetical protein
MIQEGANLADISCTVNLHISGFNSGKRHIFVNYSFYFCWLLLCVYVHGLVRKLLDFQPLQNCMRILICTVKIILSLNQSIHNHRIDKVLPWAVTSQLQWQTEASGWAASAACPHHPTAGVGHSRGSYVGRTARYTHKRGRRTNQHMMTDELLSYGTIFNSRDDYDRR